MLSMRAIILQECSMERVPNVVCCVLCVGKHKICLIYQLLRDTQVQITTCMGVRVQNAVFELVKELFWSQTEALSCSLTTEITNRATFSTSPLPVTCAHAGVSSGKARLRLDTNASQTAV